MEEEKVPSLSGTDKEVMVQPKLETLRCMLPLLSSKSSAFCWSPIVTSVCVCVLYEQMKIDQN